ncbi:RNA-binding protein [uncultured Candidatus Thioglobus sp.]|jgi:RNA recognition motif-containing protein|uniref:RNA recognition motif domain-containing protein n=1 Tax=uncultured Candidatus Thioglobus sp. TaxID=655186 RepID=UPI001E05C3BA|nr:RNA-binding protein [Candidatus Thioglobus sp.]
MKILIRNLPRTFTEIGLKELFEAHGEVQSCTLVLDKKTSESKGFGFVEIAKVGDAKVAIQALNGKPINGNKIRVKKAEPAKNA